MQPTRQPSRLSQTHDIGCGTPGIEPLSTNHEFHLEKSVIKYGSEGRVYQTGLPNFAEYPSSIEPNQLPEAVCRSLSLDAIPHLERGLERDYRVNIRPDSTGRSHVQGKIHVPRWFCTRKKGLNYAAIVTSISIAIVVTLASTHQLTKAKTPSGSAAFNSSAPGPSEE